MSAAIVSTADNAISLALETVRAARLRRQLADEGSSIFVHAPRPSTRVNLELDQKEFGAIVRPENDGVEVLISVTRPVKENYALLYLSIHGWPSRIHLAATDLRAMAARLLDAAHDIETHPATLDTAEGAA